MASIKNFFMGRKDASLKINLGVPFKKGGW